MERLQFIVYNLTVLMVIAVALAGIVPVWLGNQAGDVLSFIVAIGGLGAAGYHIPMHRSGKSKVCDNRFSYWIMACLSFLCILLVIVTIFHEYDKLL